MKGTQINVALIIAVTFENTDCVVNFILQYARIVGRLEWSQNRIKEIKKKLKRRIF